MFSLQSFGNENNTKEGNVLASKTDKIKEFIIN